MSAITTDSDRGALLGTPMNDSPYSFPRTTLASLSDDARLLAAQASHHLDRDVFTDRPGRYVPREEADAFKPTQRMLDAIAELEGAGLASYHAQYKSFSLTNVHPNYTFAFGRGSQFIRVTTFLEHPQHDEQLLAVFIGADIESKDNRSGGIPTVDVRARHDTGTDFEHDASSTAILSVLNPTAPVWSGYGRMVFHGVLSAARLYPLGTDLESVEDGDTTAGEVCTDCEKPHPFLPYQPPKIGDLSGQFVTVEALPFRPYIIHDPAVAVPGRDKKKTKSVKS